RAAPAFSGTRPTSRRASRSAAASSRPATTTPRARSSRRCSGPRPRTSPPSAGSNRSTSGSGTRRRWIPTWPRWQTTPSPPRPPPRARGPKPPRPPASPPHPPPTNPAPTPPLAAFALPLTAAASEPHGEDEPFDIFAGALERPADTSEPPFDGLRAAPSSVEGPPPLAFEPATIAFEAPVIPPKPDPQSAARLVRLERFLGAIH